MLLGLRSGGFGGVTMAPAADFQGASAPFAFATRTIMSFRRDQGAHPPMDAYQDAVGEQQELVAFQRHVADLFQDLAADGDEVLSIAWVRRLIDSFLVCQEEFRVILLSQRRASAPAPLDRLVSDFFERTVKALDVCNAVRDGVEQLHQWQKHLEIVLVALGPQKLALCEGHFRRAKKALAELAVLMLDDKESGSILSRRNRSFGRNGGSTSSSSSGRSSHFRSQSWSVSRSWSAARQLQAIGSNLAAPRSHDVAATAGLALPVYTMSEVLLFVMWVLVAAIPCQDRGLQIHFSIPRSFPCAAPIMSLYEGIVEESKKKDRKNSIGLLKEIYQIEKSVRRLTDLTDAVQSPMSEEKEEEVRQAVQDLAQVCEAMKKGLDPLERQVREVFLRIVRSRTEGLENLSNGAE